jgi:hypothetical protein
MLTLFQRIVGPELFQRIAENCLCREEVKLRAGYLRSDYSSSSSTSFFFFFFFSFFFFFFLSRRDTN